MRPLLALSLLIALGTPAEARQHRSQTVLREWRLTHPCPANGAVRGSCPGFEADHLFALCMGGLDRPDSLRWLPVADHRAKTKLDIKGCLILRR